MDRDELSATDFSFQTAEFLEHLHWKSAHYKKNVRGLLLRVARYLDSRPLNEKTFREYVHFIETKGFVHPSSPNTIKQEIRYMTLFVQWLVDEKILTNNWARKIERPENQDIIYYPVPKDKILKLLKLATTPGKHDHKLHRFSKNEHYWALVFLVATGIRNFEVRQLLTEDINLELREATVPHAKGGQPKVVTIPKWPWLLDELQKRKAERGQRERLFVVNEMRLQATMRKVKKLGNVPVNTRMVVHTLRNIYANDLFDSGADIERVRIALGHRDIKTTQRYLKHNGSMRKRIVDEFESVSQRYKTNDERVEMLRHEIEKKTWVESWNIVNGKIYAVLSLK